MILIKYPNPKKGLFKVFAFFALIASLVIVFFSATTTAVYSSEIKIGLLADTHYDRVLYPNRLTIAQKAVSIFNEQGVNLILGLGDMYEGGFKSLDDYLQNRTFYEVPYAASTAPVRWVVGNHDIYGISVSDYTNNSTYAPKNWVYDLPDNWRIIGYTNVEWPLHSASKETLNWFRSSLDQARTDGKKVVIANHAHIDLDYPSTPRYLIQQVDPTTRVAGTVLTPSSTTGIATVSASLTGTFEAKDIDRSLHLLYGTTWGWGTITSINDSKTVTVNIKSAYGGTGPADKAEIGGYSHSSLNADDQRNIINEAVAAGTQVKYVFSGHMHRKSESTVNGVIYYGFPNVGDTGASSILTLGDISPNINWLTLSPQTPVSNYSDYYVDGIKGNDTNDGKTRTTAWKTLNKALTNSKTAGKVVTILPATYRERVFFWIPGGTVDKPVTWVYEPGAKQTCANIITDFNGPDTQGWFTKTLSTETKTVIEDGKPLGRGNYNSGAVAGTWDWNGGILYYKPSSGRFAEHIIEAGQSGSALQIPRAVQYLKIKGGEFYGCNSNGIIIQESANNILLEGVTSWGNANGLRVNSSGTGNNITRSKFIKNDAGISVSSNAAPTISYSLISNNLSSGIEVTNTAAPTFYNILSYGNKYGFKFSNSGNPGPVVHNSITSANTVRGIHSSDSGISAVYNSIIADGAIWGNTTNTNISTADPIFINPSSGNFKLNSVSPAIDFGTSIGLTTDYIGNSIQGTPDAGIYEYQKP